MKEKKSDKIETEKERINTISPLLFIPGCFLIGLAFGFLLGKLLFFSLLGLGIGFVLSAIFKSLMK